MELDWKSLQESALKHVDFMPSIIHLNDTMPNNSRKQHHRMKNNESRHVGIDDNSIAKYSENGVISAILERLQQQQQYLDTIELDRQKLINTLAMDVKCAVERIDTLEMKFVDKKNDVSRISDSCQLMENLTTKVFIRQDQNDAQCARVSDQMISLLQRVLAAEARLDIVPSSEEIHSTFNTLVEPMRSYFECKISHLAKSIGTLTDSFASASNQPSGQSSFVGTSSIQIALIISDIARLTQRVTQVDAQFHQFENITNEKISSLLHEIRHALKQTLNENRASISNMEKQINEDMNKYRLDLIEITRLHETTTKEVEKLWKRTEIWEKFTSNLSNFKTNLEDEYQNMGIKAENRFQDFVETVSQDRKSLHSALDNVHFQINKERKDIEIIEQASYQNATQLGILSNTVSALSIEIESIYKNFKMKFDNLENSDYENIANKNVYYLKQHQTVASHENDKSVFATNNVSLNDAQRFSPANIRDLTKNSLGTEGDKNLRVIKISPGHLASLPQNDSESDSKEAVSIPLTSLTPNTQDERSAQCEFCLKRIALDNMKDHFENCYLVLYPCPLNCGAKLLTRNMDRHIKSCSKILFSDLDVEEC